MTTFNPKTDSAYTTPSKSFIGFGSKDLKQSNNIYGIIFSTKSYKEVDFRQIQKINNKKDLKEIENKIDSYINETKKDIIDNFEYIKSCEKKIKDIQSLNVKNSNKTIKEYIKKLLKEKSNRNLCWIALKDIQIIDNIVQIPSSVEPFYYSSTKDLTNFDVGDIIEVSFGTGSKVPKKYKGKIINYIVNNLKDYTWDKPYRKLALTPNEKDWRKSEIILIDGYGRFMALMIDLFPCNRRHFSGWKTKTVGIRKKGHQNTLPRPFEDDALSLDNLTHVPKDAYVITYNGSEITGVEKGNNFYNSYKIYTKRDARLAIEYLKNKIKTCDRNCASLEGLLKEYSEVLKDAEMLKNHFKD